MTCERPHFLQLVHNNTPYMYSVSQTSRRLCVCTWWPLYRVTIRKPPYESTSCAVLERVSHVKLCVLPAIYYSRSVRKYTATSESVLRDLRAEMLRHVFAHNPLPWTAGLHRGVVIPYGYLVFIFRCTSIFVSLPTFTKIETKQPQAKAGRGERTEG